MLGITKSALDRLPYEEVQGWFSYFEQRPYGWRDDDRTYKLMRVQGCDAKPARVFPALEPIYTPPVAPKPGQVSVKKLKQSSLFAQLMQAVGGDKTEIME